MLIVAYGNPSAGKTMFCRYLAKQYGGKTLILLNEGQVKPDENEQVVEIPKGINPLDWFKGKWIPLPEDTKSKVKCIIVDSMTGIQDAYAPIALERTLRDDKMKGKSPTEKKEMTLSAVPFGMGPAVHAEVVKEFIHFLVELSKTVNVIVTCHTQTITVVGSDQVQQDLISLNLGGKSEKSSASRMSLLQHADVVAYIDATPVTLGKTQEHSRKLIIGNSGVLVTKYRSELMGRDPFFQPRDSYDIMGRDNLTKTINELFPV
jgi:hypothetical protein